MKEQTRLKWENRSLSELIELRHRAKTIEAGAVAVRRTVAWVLLGFVAASITMAVSVPIENLRYDGSRWWDIAWWTIIALYALFLAVDIIATLVGRRIDRIMIIRRFALAYAAKKAFERMLGFPEGDER